MTNLLKPSNFDTDVLQKIFYYAVILFLFSLPLSEALKQISIGIIFLISIYWIFFKKIKIKLDIISISIILHLIIVFIGIFVGINFHESLKQFKDIFTIVILFLIFRSIDLEKIEIKDVIYILAISFLVTSLWGMYEYYLNNADFLKLKSVGSVNRSATYTIFMFIILFGFYLRDEKNYILLIVVIFTAFFAVLSGSRMAIFSLPLITIIMMLLYDRLNFKKIIYIGLFFIILALVIFSFFHDSRVANKILIGFSDSPRIDIWISCLSIWLEHNLFFGIGVGNSIFFNPENYVTNASIGYIDNAHNTYLDMLMERGLFGLFSYLSFSLSMAYYFFKNLKYDYNKMGLGLIIASYIMSFANITFRYEFAILCVIIWGLILNTNKKKVVS